MTTVTMIRVPRGKRGHFLRRIVRLLERAVQSEKKVLVVVENQAKAEQLSQQIWSLEQGSFVPHAVEGGEATGEDPVVILHESAPSSSADVILNFAPPAVKLSWRCEPEQWVYDFVNPDTEDGRRVAQVKWSSYKEEPVELTHAEEL